MGRWLTGFPARLRGGVSARRPRRALRWRKRLPARPVDDGSLGCMRPGLPVVHSFAKTVACFEPSAPFTGSLCARGSLWRTVANVLRKGLARAVYL